MLRNTTNVFPSKVASCLVVFLSKRLTYLNGIQMKDPRRQASELREKLLKEKIKKMRTSSIDSTNAQANTR